MSKRFALLGGKYISTSSPDKCDGSCGTGEPCSCPQVNDPVDTFYEAANKAFIDNRVSDVQGFEDIDIVADLYMYHLLMASMYNDEINQRSFITFGYYELLNLLRCHTEAAHNMEHIVYLHDEITYGQ